MLFTVLIRSFFAMLFFGSNLYKSMGSIFLPMLFFDDIRFRHYLIDIAVITAPFIFID
jgi:hypothetical protein